MRQASELQSHRWLALIVLSTFVVGCGRTVEATGQTAQPSPRYNIYAGNVHAHTEYTWSHGAQWAQSRAPRGEASAGAGGAARRPERVLKEDWRQHQGPPAEHFARAKAAGYDFYVVSDHSHEKGLQPVSPTNPQWLDTKRAAADATDDRFVALAGFEHSENNGPGGTGHINVINSATYLNALSDGVDLPHLYRWIATVESNHDHGDGPIVGSFNHPRPQQYDNWAHRDAQVTDVITMLEVINSNDHVKYEAFVNALDKGWKVSPVCGNDNHGFRGITQHTSRTFVLAAARTKRDILDAMRHRRTYASLENNIRCTYSVNEQIMGSTLRLAEGSSANFRFEILISDPDTADAKDKVTKVDIITDGGAIVQTFEPPTPSHSLTWRPSVANPKSKYFFVRVWNAGGGDAPSADPNEPVAWLAPVWTGR